MKFNKNEVKNRDHKLQIISIIKSNLPAKVIADKILDFHESDIADTLELLKKNERAKLYSILDAKILASILEYTQDEDYIKFIDELSTEKKIQVLTYIEVPDAVEYLKTLEKKERYEIIDKIAPEVREDIILSASFDEETIGSKMSTNFICISNTCTIKEAMSELVRQAADNDNIQTIYVVDENEKYYGAIDLTDLIIARKDEKLENLIMLSYPYVYSYELIDDCIPRIMQYSEDSFPVLNAENKISGVLIAEDLAEIIDEEFGEDYAKLAGLSSEEDIKEPFFESIKKRLPWLLVLLVLGLLVSSVVGLFEKVVASLTLIVSFQSLVLDMAGNVGTQSLAVTIRVLMDEKLDFKQKLALIFKETRVGLGNGIILGILSFIFVGLYLFLIKKTPVHIAFTISLCIGIALIIAMLLSSLSGTTIPMIFKKIGIDPAVASGPLITTINDMIAVVSYYGLAWILLLNVLKI
ncbi:MAG: magnesium transporter [Clostridia bacterium]|nr:magnesium transporter [Clostridia bacterium]